MEFRVLGTLEVGSDERSGPPPGAKERAVLARLLIDPGRPVAADALLEAGWPDSPRELAARSLGVRIANLRAFLEPGRAPGAPAALLVRTGPGYRLAVEPEQVDSQRARRLVSEAAAAEPARALALLDEALDLWRGPPFADFTYADFAQGEIAALEELRRQAVERRASALVEVGRGEEAVPELRRLLGEDPLREGAVRTLMTALYRAGRRVDALEAYRLLSGELIELGLQPAPATRELERQMLSQDEALSAPAVRAPEPEVRPGEVPLGRDVEVARLRAEYAAACAGRRRVVAVSGEPGVGKSAIVEALLDAIGGDALVATGQCIEHRGSGEPFMPVLEALGGLAAGPGSETVVATLAQCAPTWLAELPWLLDADDFEALEHRIRGATRSRMLREIAEAFDALARRSPLVLVLEDMHWADDSTLDLVDALARRGTPSQLLLLVTFRTDRPSGSAAAQRLVHDLSVRGLCEHVPVSRLGSEAVARYLATRVPGAADELAPVLAERSGGNPLFMRHLVDHWIDRGGGDAAGGLPDTLRSYIETQLDWLGGDDVELLGAASVAGGRFSPDVLAGALDRPPEAIAARCATLARTTRLIERRADGYAFAHGLDREVLYELVPEDRRAELHRRIGAQLEARYGARAPERAAELARHFEEGHEPARAVRFLALAAQRSLRRNAYAEGVRQLRAALATAGQLVADAERTRWEVELLSQLAHALVATEGWSSAGAEAALADARERAELLPDREPLAAVLYALATMYEVRGDIERSLELSNEYLREGSDAGERRIEAQELLACNLFHQGAFATALERADHGVALAAEGTGSNQSLFAALPGEDMGVSCQMWGGLSLWYLGHPDAALARARQAHELASAPARAYSEATALAQLALVHQFRLEPSATLEWAESTIAVADARSYVYRSAMGRVLRGWALAQLGSPEAGAEEAARGLAMSRMTGARLDDPYYLGLLADGYLRAGELDAARAAIDEGLELSERDGAPFYEPELRRLLALVLIARGDTAGAEAELRAAIACARGQESRSLELRAATTLAELLSDSGRAGEARAIVASVYEGFEEGHETRDLRAAAALLER